MRSVSISIFKFLQVPNHFCIKIQCDFDSQCFSGSEVSALASSKSEVRIRCFVEFSGHNLHLKSY